MLHIFVFNDKNVVMLSAEYDSNVCKLRNIAKHISIIKFTRKNKEKSSTK